MAHLDLQTEGCDNEGETNSVTSEEITISSYYLDCCQR